MATPLVSSTHPAPPGSAPAARPGPIRLQRGLASPRRPRPARAAATLLPASSLAPRPAAEPAAPTQQTEPVAPRPGAAPVHLLPLLQTLDALPPFTACLGLAEDGRPLLVRLTSREAAHLLVAGEVAAGKTELMRAVIMSLALMHRQSQLQLALIDSAAGGFAPLGGLRHLLTPPARTPGDAIDLLWRLVDELERRDQQGIGLPRILVAVDELADLARAGGRETVGLLLRLLQRGRETGIHLLVGTQALGLGEAEGRTLLPLLRARFPVRLVGHIASAEAARLASGQDELGADILAGRGDFLAVAEGQITRFQAAWLPPEAWAELDSPLQ